jgi:DNA-binding transcriptional ArsR family regulator
MITMHLRAADLADTSFAISPVHETVFSLWVWRRPERQPFHLSWRQAMLPAWQSIDHEILNLMMAPDSGWLPDFLTPRPTGPLTEFETELRAVANTPWRKVRADLEVAYGDEPLPTALRGSPTAVRERIVAAVADYHRRCIEPFWPRIRAVLEADIAFRARRLADAGARGLFDELDWRVRWDDGHIIIDQLKGLDHRIEIDGRGLPLVPSLFVRGAVTYISATEPPVVVYPARGRGAVWDTAPPPVDTAVAELLGLPRARLLTLLREPATTTDLARRLGVTPGAVSQHLRVLHDARLVSRTRAGRSVLYLRSELADALVGT